MENFLGSSTEIGISTSLKMLGLQRKPYYDNQQVDEGQSSKKRYSVRISAQTIQETETQLYGNKEIAPILQEEQANRQPRAVKDSESTPEASGGNLSPKAIKRMAVNDPREATAVKRLAGVWPQTIREKAKSPDSARSNGNSWVYGISALTKRLRQSIEPTDDMETEQGEIEDMKNELIRSAEIVMDKIANGVTSFANNVAKRHADWRNQVADMGKSFKRVIVEITTQTSTGSFTLQFLFSILNFTF